MSELGPREEFFVRSNIEVALGVAGGRFRNCPPGSWELADLEGIALLALVKSAVRWPSYCVENHFDPNQISYFRAYALRACSGSLIDAMRAASPLTRTELDSVSRLRKARSRGKTDDQAARELDWSADQLASALQADRIRSVSLDEAVEVPDEGLSWDGSYLTRAFDRLPRPVQDTLVLRYQKRMSLAKIGSVLGVPSAEVSSMLRTAQREFLLTVRESLGV